jgi:hypothetical protein
MFHENLFSETKLDLLQKFAAVFPVAPQERYNAFGADKFTAYNYLRDQTRNQSRNPAGANPKEAAGIFWDPDQGFEGNLTGWGDFIGGGMGSAFGGLTAGGASLLSGPAAPVVGAAAVPAGAVMGSVVGKGIGSNVLGGIGRGIDWLRGHKATEQELGNRGVMKQFTPDAFDLVSAVPFAGKVVGSGVKAGLKHGVKAGIKKAIPGAVQGVARDARAVGNMVTKGGLGGVAQAFNPLSSRGAVSRYYAGRQGWSGAGAAVALGATIPAVTGSTQYANPFRTSPLGAGSSAAAAGTDGSTPRLSRNPLRQNNSRGYTDVVNRHGAHLGNVALR